MWLAVPPPPPLPTGPPMQYLFPDLLGVFVFCCGLSYFTQPHSNKDHVQIERRLVLRRVLTTETFSHVSTQIHSRSP